ncbi:hypothetical protein N8558_01020, partial [bacterium]|nr:hypothetical protein [bacterium]
DIIKWHDSKDIPLWLEPKYDGIRSQLHVTPDGAHLFSRDLRSLDDEFPEILEAARALPPCLLDGELIAYAEGKRLTFFDLQKPIRRAPTTITMAAGRKFRVISFSERPSR